MAEQFSTLLKLVRRMSVLSRWKKELHAYRQHVGGEPPIKLARRMVQTAFEAGFVNDIVKGSVTNLPRLAGLLAKEGLDVGTVYKLYACTHPERIALTDARRKLTYEEAEEEITQLEQALRRQLGVHRRTPVVLMMQNRVEYLLLWMALIRLGATIVHASWRQTADEFAYQLEHSEGRLLFADDSVRPVVEEICEREPHRDLTVIGVDGDLGQIRYQKLLQVEVGNRGDEAPQPPTRDERESEEDRRGSGNIVYTSGTTGRPKGAVRDLTTFGLVEFFRILERLPVETADRHLIVTPLYHSGAQAFSLMHAALGATLFLEPEFDARRTLQRLDEEKIHSIFMVPTMIRQILDLPREVHEQYPGDNMRALLSGAAPFPQALRRRAIDRFGASVVHDFYGATEIGWVTLINGQEMLDRPRSVGRPLSGHQIRIMDEDGEVLVTGQTGLIYVQNAQTMSGYLKNEEATDATLRDGWMTVDDLGYLDDEGYLYVVGRHRDMVISGGVNIYPAEIEEVLTHHEAVDEVAIIGVDDDQWGEALVAVVVLQSDISAEELEAYVGEHLSDYKVPRRWHFVDGLPRNPTGKVLKRKLVDQFGPCDRIGRH